MKLRRSTTKLITGSISTTDSTVYPVLRCTVKCESCTTVTFHARPLVIRGHVVSDVYTLVNGVDRSVWKVTYWFHMIAVYTNDVPLIHIHRCVCLSMMKQVCSCQYIFLDYQLVPNDSEVFQTFPSRSVMNQRLWASPKMSSSTTLPEIRGWGNQCNSQKWQKTVVII